jgi:hypothetical protein
MWEDLTPPNDRDRLSGVWGAFGSVGRLDCFGFASRQATERALLNRDMKFVGGEIMFAFSNGEEKALLRGKVLRH